MIALLLATVAHATNIDPKCLGTPKPANYSDQVQQDFLANYYALTFTMSPMHAPVPDTPGDGSVGLVWHWLQS